MPSTVSTRSLSTGSIPLIHPAATLTDHGRSWVGRWQLESCGWRFTIDSRPDLVEALQAASEVDEQYLLTHVGELRRADGTSFDGATAVELLFGWQLAMSFALGRWVAPAVPVGFDHHQRRVWEQWAPWRCDTVRGYESWWDTQTGDDLADFVAAFIRAYLDPDRHDEVRLAVMHVIAANHSGTTGEGKVMLAQAGLGYLAWVRLVLSGRMSRGDYKAMNAAERLRLLLTEAGIRTSVPDGLPGLFDLARASSFDGPSATAWVRNRLVHPKDAGRALSHRGARLADRSAAPGVRRAARPARTRLPGKVHAPLPAQPLGAQQRTCAMGCAVITSTADSNRPSHDPERRVRDAAPLTLIRNKTSPV